MTNRRATLDRQWVIETLLKQRTDQLLVSGLGNTSWDVFNNSADRDDNFYLWGAMGGTVALTLGLALAQPTRRVVAITGDGDMLMSLGSLATLGVQQPTNVAIIVIDNQRYAETGGQSTHTAHGIDLSAIAKACGIENSACVHTKRELHEAIPTVFDQGTTAFVCIKVSAATKRGQLPPRHGPYLKDRFRRHLNLE